MKNKIASIRQRLLNLAKKESVDFKRILTRYGIERLLHRLSIPFSAGSREARGPGLPEGIRNRRDVPAAIDQMGADAVIPSKANRKQQRPLDAKTYKRRNRVERFFCLLKQFRRIATRYEKLASRYAAFALVVAGFIWREV